MTMPRTVCPENCMHTVYFTVHCDLKYEFGNFIWLFQHETT